MEVLHPIKVAIPAFAKQKQNQLQPKSFRPLSVSCSNSQKIAAPLRDEEGPLLKSDWRAFRARLVASERAQITPSNPALTADPYTSMGHSLPLEGKWAHTIPEPEKGCLLIATEKLDGNHIYKRTVILLLSTGPTCLTGLILNRPSFMSIKEMKSLASNIHGPLSDRPLFFGGPLFEGLFLVNAKQGENGAKPSGVFDEVVKGVCYGSMDSLGCADEMERELGEFGDFRFFDGYCAWEREELRDEIRAGHWTVAACSPNVIGHDNVGSVGLWEEVNELVGRRNVC